MPEIDVSGYIDGEVVKTEDRRYLDSFEGTRDEAYSLALRLGKVLRKQLKIDDLLISVEWVKPRLWYLYLEAERA